MPIEAGRLRHRLIILRPDREQDSTTGEMETTWSTLATVWGSFEPLSVKEVIAASAEQNQISIRAVIRYRSDVTASMRVSFRGKTYEIVGPPLQDRDSNIEYLTLMLAEVLNA